MSGLLDFLQAASNTAASNVAGPVDLISLGLRTAGVPVGDAPVGSTEWFRRQGLWRDVPQSAASLAGEAAGILTPMLTAAKAPQIAAGLLKMQENAAHPSLLNPQLGAIVYHGSPHKFDSGKTYSIAHRPMNTQGGAATLDDLAKSFGDDIYGKNALQYFGSGDAREASTLKIMQSLRGKPDAKVTIYRGVPKNVSGVNSGDWVTLNRSVAEDYARQLPEGGKVIKMVVPAKSITSWADSLLEFGYYP